MKVTRSVIIDRKRIKALIESRAEILTKKRKSLRIYSARKRITTTEFDRFIESLLFMIDHPDYKSKPKKKVKT